MDCHKADELMMKYMDDFLDTAEAELLGQHVSACEKCKADFRMYDDILTGFSEMEFLSAPDGFEESVMLKVMELPSFDAKLSSTMDNMLCLIWGAFSVLFGVGVLATLNRDAIMEYLYSTPGFEGYAGALVLVGEYVTSFSASLSLVLNQLLTATSGYVSASRYILIAALGVLATVQYFMHRRSKVS